MTDHNKLFQMTAHHNYIVIPIILFRTGEDLQTRTYTGPF